MGKDWDAPCRADLSKAADADGVGHGAAAGKGTVSPGQDAPGPPAAPPLHQDVPRKLLPQHVI